MLGITQNPHEQTSFSRFVIILGPIFIAKLTKYLPSFSSAIQPFFEGLCMEDIETKIVKSWNVGSPSNGRSHNFAFCNFKVIVVRTQENIETNPLKQLVSDLIQDA